MSTILGALFGALVGGVVAWVLVKRMMEKRQPAARVSTSLPLEDVFASETATHMAQNLSAEHAFDPLAYTLIERCANVSGMPVALVMRERLGGVPTIVAVSSGLDHRLLGREMHLDTPAGRAITSALPVVSEPNEKVLDISRGDRRQVSPGGVAIPVAQGGQVYGALLVFGEAPGGSIDLLKPLSDEIRKFAPVIITSFLAAAAARQAETDELTGLPNRRALNAVLSRGTIERASLIVFDIDHFKKVNDTLGHAAGDQALRHVSRVVRDTIRGRDFPARIGGEEFAIWLPGADPRIGREVAERLRNNVEKDPFRFDGEDHRITISLGVASFPKPIKAVENLMRVADAALYRAKSGGRNRVEASEGEAA